VLQGVVPGKDGVEVTDYLLVANVLARMSSVTADGEPLADALATALVVASGA